MMARIDLCCNDPDNGDFAGFVSAVQVGDLELMSNQWWRASRPGPRLRVEGQRFILAGKSWPFAESKSWYGNWCWDAFWVEPSVCADFLIWLHGSRLMQVEAGEMRVFNLWKGEGCLASSRDFLERYFGKPSTYAPA